MPFQAGRSIRLIGIAIFCTLVIGATTEPTDLFSLAGTGAKMSRDEAARLEAALRVNPNADALRTQLLGFYSLRPEDDSAQRRPHVLWMVQNRPADPFSASGYCRIDPAIDRDGDAQVKALWISQQAKEPDNPGIIRNAATYLAESDDATAEQLLRHGEELQPKDDTWPEQLARLYERRALNNRDSTAKSAWLALAERQKACYLTHDPVWRFHVFLETPRDAVRAGDFVLAKKLALQSLDMADLFHDDPEYGTALHVANIALGRVALHTGDVDTANTYLLAAGQVPATGRLQSEGPDMSLAEELLKRGQRRTVHDYLTACARTWKAGAQRIQSWIAAVDAGGTPEFGAQSLN